MSTTLTRVTVGFDSETTYAVRNRAAPLADTVTYKFFENEPFKFPIEKPNPLITPIFTSYDYNAWAAGRRIPEFTLKYNLLEGQHLRRPLGESAHGGGGGPTYTNTLTGREPGDTNAPELPSVSIHIAHAGLTNARYWDLCGCVSEQFDFGSRRDIPGIYATEKFKYQRITDDNATHTLAGGADATVAACAYTAAPAPCVTGVTEAGAYQWYLTEVKHGAGPTNVVSDIETINVRIVNELLPVFTNRTTTTNYNLTINKHPAAYFLKNRRYFVTLEARPSDSIFAFFDYIQQEDANSDLTLKWERAGSHSIAWVFDTTYCPVTDFGGPTHFSSEQEMLFPIVLQPKDLNSLTIVDGSTANYSTW